MNFGIIGKLKKWRAAHFDTLHDRLQLKNTSAERLTIVNDVLKEGFVTFGDDLDKEGRKALQSIIDVLDQSNKDLAILANSSLSATHELGELNGVGGSASRGESGDSEGSALSGGNPLNVELAQSRSRESYSSQVDSLTTSNVLTKGTPGISESLRSGGLGLMDMV